MALTPIKRNLALEFVLVSPTNNASVRSVRCLSWYVRYVKLCIKLSVKYRPYYSVTFSLGGRWLSYRYAGTDILESYKRNSAFGGVDAPTPEDPLAQKFSSPDSSWENQVSTEPRESCVCTVRGSF